MFENVSNISVHQKEEGKKPRRRTWTSISTKVEYMPVKFRSHTRVTESVPRQLSKPKWLRRVISERTRIIEGNFDWLVLTLGRKLRWNTKLQPVTRIASHFLRASIWKGQFYCVIAYVRRLNCAWSLMLCEIKKCRGLNYWEHMMPGKFLLPLTKYWICLEIWSLCKLWKVVQPRGI